MESINWHSFFFYLFSAIACVFAVGVVVTSNVVRMAFYLILSLAATAGLFFLAGADFVGAMQLMIYVGGTLVLLIFGVMLTAQGPFITMRTRGGDWVLAAILGSALLAMLSLTAWNVTDWHHGEIVTVEAEEGGEEIDAVATAELAGRDVRTSTPLGLALLGARVDRLSEPDETRRNGMSGYLLPFEIVSVHLLIVLIGAAYLARTKRRKPNP